MTNYSLGGQLDGHHSYVRAKIFEKKTRRSSEDPTSRKKEGRVTKEVTKKMKKGDKKHTIEIGEEEEEERGACHKKINKKNEERRQEAYD